MSIVSRLFSRGPQNFTSSFPDVQLVNWVQSASSSSAMRISTYFACVNVLSQDVAKLPLILYRRTADGGRERATGHPMYRLMHDRPNSWQTSYLFRQWAQAHIGVSGNAYALKTKVGGRVRELLPIHPDRVQVEQGRDWGLLYKVDGKPYNASDILHVRGLSLDGFTGVSVATHARQSLDLAFAQEQHASTLFSNGAMPRGILTIPQSLRDEKAIKRLSESFDTAFGGSNANRTAVLEEGMKYDKLSMSPEDAQFIQSREWQAYEIARWFRIPPHKVGLLKTATYSSLEQQNLEYVTDTLLSWLTNWEQELNRSLLTPAEQDEYYFEHLVDGLLRGDQKSRYQAYKDAILTGFMSRNEVRRLENMNPADGLDEFLYPYNMGPADTLNNETPDE